MNQGKRASVSAIAAMIILGKNIPSIFCYSQSKYISLSGNANRNQVNIFDYDRHCYVTGTASSPGKFSLFDYGSSSYISLEINQNKFSGFDNESGRHYSGEVNRGSISMFDYDESKYFSFSI